MSQSQCHQIAFSEDVGWMWKFSDSQCPLHPDQFLKINVNFAIWMLSSILTTQDKKYLCCQRAARLEVSLAGEVTERAVKVSSYQSLTWMYSCRMNKQIPRPFTNIWSYSINSIVLGRWGFMSDIELYLNMASKTGIDSRSVVCAYTVF